MGEVIPLDGDVILEAMVLVGDFTSSRILLALVGDFTVSAMLG